MALYGMVRTHIIAFCSILFAVIACCCLGFLLVELTHVLKHFKKREERLWIGVGVASLEVSAFACVSFTPLICIGSFYSADISPKIAPAPSLPWWSSCCIKFRSSIFIIDIKVWLFLISR